jgi:hypothetical protein
MAKAAVLASIAMLATNNEATNTMAKSFMTSYQKVMRLVCAWSAENDAHVAAKPGGMQARFAALCILAADLRTVVEALEALAAIPGSNLFAVEAKGVRVLVHADGGTPIGALFPHTGSSLATSELAAFAETYVNNNGGRVDEDMMRNMGRMGRSFVPIPVHVGPVC